MGVLIHTSAKRFRYVNDFMRWMLRTPNCVYLDRDGMGNMKAYIESFKYWIEHPFYDERNTWHIEDDVLPDRRITKWMEEMEGREGIICGFGTTEKFGEVKPEDMWYSFPCIRIPNDYLRDFVKWIETSGDEDVAERMKLGKGIDFLFHKFVVQNPIQIYHTVPCMVEHIDEYIGGSLINERKEPIKAIRFEDTERLAELKDWVKEN